jgi:hypothetical protein
VPPVWEENFHHRSSRDRDHGTGILRHRSDGLEEFEAHFHEVKRRKYLAKTSHNAFMKNRQSYHLLRCVHATRVVGPNPFCYSEDIQQHSRQSKWKSGHLLPKANRKLNVIEFQ